MNAPSASKVAVRTLSVVLLAMAPSLLAGPIPTAPSTVNVTYQSGGNPVVLSAVRNYNGTSPSDATSLDPAYNVKEFNSANGFGRRVAVAISYPEVIGEDETLISHNFFKSDISGPFFPGISADGVITFEIDSIQFDQPVFVEESTAVFHTLWDLNQIRELDEPYHHAHNLHTLTDQFRDYDKFVATNELDEMNMGHSRNHVLGDMAGRIIITGEGTDTLHLMAEVPYSLLQNLAEMGQEVPEGLPAPHGFLEPFHFHFEYVVSTVPEPASLLLMLPLAALISNRSRRRRE